jgi:hypothetical protein
MIYQRPRPYNSFGIKQRRLGKSLTRIETGIAICCIYRAWFHILNPHVRPDVIFILFNSLDTCQTDLPSDFGSLKNRCAKLAL